jgi:TatD DNase family protein
MDAPELMDTHCHLDFDWFAGDRDTVVDRARQAGVGRIIVPAIDLAGCSQVLDLAERFEEVYAAVGVHPNSTAGWQDHWIDELRRLSQHEKVVAIGEIGLDYYRDRAPKQTQQRALELQLRLAAELALPVILHNRESSQDLLRLLSGSPLNGRESPGVLHSFSASWETARSALDMGFYLGFTGPVTYPKADALRQVVARAPRERILMETDAPFLAPQKFRGKRNEPGYVTEVAQRVGLIWGVELTQVGRLTSDNAVRLFGERLG